MQIVTAENIKGKKVLLRLDLDVPIKDGKVVEDFRLKMDIPTLRLCVDNASKVTIIGHLGRPEGIHPEYSLKPVYEWFKANGFSKMSFWKESQLRMQENLRFNPGEEQADKNFAKELAHHHDVYVFESFASHRIAASTTILPTIMKSYAGGQFAKEVQTLTSIRQNPNTPLMAVVGGAKVEDKYQSLLALARFCTKILVGGLLAERIREQGLEVPENVSLGTNNVLGLDISEETMTQFKAELSKAAQIIWAGPVGKYEDAQSREGTKVIAETILASGKEAVIGGGDTISALGILGLLDKCLQSDKIFVSTGGGAMLNLLAKGSLPTIDALK